VNSFSTSGLHHLKSRLEEVCQKLSCHHDAV